jgi:hypothetical protein
MNVRVMFFKDDSEPLLASKEQKHAFKEMKISNPLIEQGYIDINTEEDPTYLYLLLHSDLIEVFDGVYKIKQKQFRAMNPYALWIGLGEKIPQGSKKDFK